MICPMCGREMRDQDVTYYLGVAGHFECHGRQRADYMRMSLGVLACGLLVVGGMIGLMVWYLGEVVRR